MRKKNTDEIVRGCVKTFATALPKNDRVVARLFLVVEYDTQPDMADVREIVEKAQETGGTDVAMLESVAPSWQWVN